MIESLVGGIVDGISSFFQGIIAGAVQGAAMLADQVVQLLPAAAPLSLPDMSGWIRGYSILNEFLPLSEALALTGTLITIYAGLFLWRLANRIWHLIPKPFMGT